MKHFRLIFLFALMCMCSTDVFAWDVDEVFGDPEVSVDGNKVSYSYDQDAFYDMFEDFSYWNNTSVGITVYNSDDTVAQTGHIEAWNEEAVFDSDIDIDGGQYIVFGEGVYQLDVYDEEGDVAEKFKSPEYTYKPTSSSIKTATTSADNAIYNLQGVRLQKMQKGINIINGKKVIL